MALQCYEEAQSFTAKMLKRNSLVRSLRRALNGYSAILNIHIDWLLRSTNAHEQCNERDRRAIFEKPEMPKLVKEFLGDVAAEAFSGAILEIVETLEILLKKIEGFLVSDDKNECATLGRVKFSNTEEVKIRYRDGFKLALRSKEIEKCIARADKATNMINSIRSAKSDIQWADIRNEKKGQVKSLGLSLVKIRDYAVRLHQTIASCWAQDCHSTHVTSLYLEDRIDPSRSFDTVESYKSILFKVIFISKRQEPQQTLQRVSSIEVFQADRCEPGYPNAPQDQSARSDPVADPLCPDNKITNICEVVCGEEQFQLSFRLYVKPQCTMHRLSKMNDTSFSTSEIISFEHLLSLTRDHSSDLRLFPLASIEFALILASALLQLSETPWFDTCWTKQSVNFLKISPSMSTASMRSSCEVDITKPLVMRSFSRAIFNTTPASTTVTTTFCKAPSLSTPKKVLLEFAILMLELWHSMPIETRFPDRLAQIHGDELDRKSLAERWLEDKDLPGFQFNVVGYCIKQLNVYRPGQELKWDDQEFLQSFVAGVVEVLAKEANKGGAGRVA
ncbi:hypothetical protein MMC10_001913 [Thelotrema lepadinum]|nr:hypothetical protein [Thelotrema lepadinum]